MLGEKDIPLVRGGKLPKEALRWLTEIEKYFPGTTKDIVIVRQKPVSALARGDEKRNPMRREKAKAMTTLPAIKDDGVNAFLQAHGGPVGEFIKFGKEARFEKLDGEEVPVGTKLTFVSSPKRNMDR